MANRALTEAEANAIRAHLHQLQIEHRDLDQVIYHLNLTQPQDELLVRRLKKRKLILKDRINQLEEMLVPDILA